MWSKWNSHIYLLKFFPGSQISNFLEKVAPETDCRQKENITTEDSISKSFVVLYSETNSDVLDHPRAADAAILQLDDALLLL